MKKVVINADYGGFGLSNEALVLLHMMRFPLDGQPLSKFGVKESEFTLEGPDGYRAHYSMGMILKDGIVYSIYDSKNDLALRSHPALVKVVEMLGERANGNSASLRVYEIADNTVYTINTYDGREQLKELRDPDYVYGYVYEDVSLPQPVQFTENQPVSQLNYDSPS